MRDSGVPHNYALVGRVAHRLKGDSGAYGFDRMSSVGVQLEEAANRRDDTAIVSLVTEPLDYLDHIDIVHRAIEQ